MEVSRDPLFRKLRKSAPLETRFFAACENGPFKKFSFSQPAKTPREARHGFATCESFTRHAPRFRNLRKLHATRATVSQLAKASREARHGLAICESTTRDRHKRKTGDPGPYARSPALTLYYIIMSPVSTAR